MIRRITRNNDYKDIIKSCPEGVIDYVYRVDYYVSGHPEVFVELTPVRVGEHLEVVISTEALANLTYNGVLMRRAYYSQIDPDYPDDSYDLEFVDSMNVWLGEEDTVAPFDPGYLTADDLKTINGESIVGEGNLEIEAVIPDYYATKSWVSDQGYLKSVPSSYATESWVSDQGYLTSIPSHYATKSWVSDQGYLTSETIPSDIATQSWVSSKNFATESWVSAQGYLTSTGVSGLATMSWVEDQGYLTSTGVSGLATMSWVEDQGYLTSTGVSGLATMSWVEDQGYLTSTGVSGLATMSWVEDQGYLISVPAGYATESWVSSQGYLTSIPAGYATESWVEDQGYLTSIPSHYATKSWVSSNYFEASKIWTGTSSQWAQLTSEQQAFYTIALVTE